MFQRMIHYLPDLYKTMRSLTPNLKNRDCNLPPGCKDLIDVFQPKAKCRPTRPVRVNKQIHAPQVRVVDFHNRLKLLGDMSLAEALQLAQTHGLDLIEIGPSETMPLCLLMDFGRYRYLTSKIGKLKLAGSINSGSENHP